ncbi:class I SAM-dependent methyltransferase [Pseudonocardia sp. TRM90224]|uniref:class I SAM-dependent methyltransferase n=1 Tax=Pseudonocardia sp. TRM90224 TaxID=2812678 RepID=UPI001E5F7FE6|nr:class I SAM-dependent methyltransferase [Pseudonocardia sp. TRM90224]
MAGVGDRLLEMGFGKPRGLLGRIGGRLMARGNAATEQHLVDLAELQRADDVLVVGPGPGIGVQAAATRAHHVVAVDPSEAMVAASARRCATSIDEGVVEVRLGDAENTGQGDASVDVVLSVNNVMLWPDRHAGFTELRRVLRPGGRMLLSVHEKWLPGGLSGLRSSVADSGFTDIETWTWEPPGRGATTAAQLRARRE